jgi:hypothetical protein
VVWVRKVRAAGQRHASVGIVHARVSESHALRISRTKWRRSFDKSNRDQVCSFFCIAYVMNGRGFPPARRWSVQLPRPTSKKDVPFGVFGVISCNCRVFLLALPIGRRSNLESTTARRGVTIWRTRAFGAIRVRMVEYSPGYRADHWCKKGHILLCLDGELHTELADGRNFVLTRGVSYQVADNAEPDRSSTTTGARLFIVD